jgi:hypothetical protein
MHPDSPQRLNPKMQTFFPVGGVIAKNATALTG